MDDTEDLNMKIKTFVEIAKPIYREDAKEIIKSCKEAGIGYKRQSELLRYPELLDELSLEYPDLIEKSKKEAIIESKERFLSEIRALKRKRLLMDNDIDLKNEIKIFAGIAQPIYRDSVKEIDAACEDAGIEYLRFTEDIRFSELIGELRKEVPINLLKPGLL